MTEDIFLREYVADRSLAQYAAVIVEDVHERTVQSEIICGILKSLVLQRADLKAILTSVPHNAEALHAYFPGSSTIHVPESVFPVDIFHAKAKKLKVAPEKNSYVQGALNVIMKVHQKNEDGHILVFLPSLNDIAVLQDQLELALRDQRTPNRELIVLPFHEGLSPPQLQKIHRAARAIDEPPPSQHQVQSQSQQPGAEDVQRVLRRKCFLVAEMPESSVHVPHVRFVVDSGYTKEIVYDAKLGCESEVIIPISKVRVFSPKSGFFSFSPLFSHLWKWEAMLLGHVFSVLYSSLV
jgi:HrpA-like RNA helicase